MKFSWAVVLLLMVGFAMPRASQAQVSVYVQGGASNMNSDPPYGVGGQYLYGGTAGLVYDGPTVFKHAVISADIQTRFVTNAGERLVGAMVGPRFTFPVKKFKLQPYGELMVGFARFRSSTSNGPQNVPTLGTTNALNTTDNEWQVGGGIAKQLTSHLDVVVAADFAEYGANNGEYNPITMEGGVVWHFTKR